MAKDEMSRRYGHALRTIRAAKMIDGKGGEPLTNQEVVVQDGWIRDIRPWTEGSLCSPGEMIDVGSATLLPGLIDAHVHLVLDAVFFSAGSKPSDVPPEEHDEAVLLRAVGNAQAALTAGVTTVCDCGGPNHLIFALREAIKSGVIKGPRVIASGNVITTSKGHGGSVGRVVATSSEEIRRAVVEQAEAGADFIKIMVTGGGGKEPGKSQYSVEELEAATAEARRLGKRIVVHCHGTLGIRDAVEAGVTRIEHCSFVRPHATDLPKFVPDVAEAIARKGIYVCPTNTVDYRQKQRVDDPEKVKRMAPRAQLNMVWRELLRCGVKFIAGSDAGISQVFCDDYALILELMVEELGMSPLQAVLAGTRVAAEALGMEDEIGTLEVGKRADIIAVGDDPLKDSTALCDVRLVLADGNIVHHRSG